MEYIKTQRVLTLWQGKNTTILLLFLYIIICLIGIINASDASSYCPCFIEQSPTPIIQLAFAQYAPQTPIICYPSPWRFQPASPNQRLYIQKSERPALRSAALVGLEMAKHCCPGKDVVSCLVRELRILLNCLKAMSLCWRTIQNREHLPSYDLRTLTIDMLKAIWFSLKKGWADSSKS